MPVYRGTYSQCNAPALSTLHSSGGGGSYPVGELEKEIEVSITCLLRNQPACREYHLVCSQLF